METHKFNEYLRRFEPLHTKCLFCRAGKDSSHMEDNCFYSVYNVQDRTNVIVYRNVKFKEVKIGVPRCEKCKSVHSKAKVTTNITIFVGVLLVFIIPIYFSVEFDLGTVGMIFMLALTAGLVFLIVFAIEKAILNGYDVKSEKDGARTVPLVRDFLRNGWTDDRPSA